MTWIRGRGRSRLVVVAALLGASFLVAAVGWAAPPSFRFYDVPSRPGGPCVTSPGPDGAAWFLETFSAKVGRINVGTGRVEEYAIPWSGRPQPAPAALGLTVAATALPCALQPGPDGKMYFANGVRNQIGSIDPATKKFELYQDPNPVGNLNPFNDITAGPDNAIWFTQTSAGRIGRFDIATKVFTDFTTPTPASVPVGVFAASDGGIWFTEAASGKVGRLDVATKKIAEYATPTPGSGPFVVRAETQGRFVWFTEIAANKIGRIDVQTKVITEYPAPIPASTPTAVCASRAGDIYYSHNTTDTLGRLDPRTGRATEIPLPNSVGSVPSELNCAPGNAVWITQVVANRVIRYALD